MSDTETTGFIPIKQVQSKWGMDLNKEKVIKKE